MNNMKVNILITTKQFKVNIQILINKTTFPKNVHKSNYNNLNKDIHSSYNIQIQIIINRYHH